MTKPKKQAKTVKRKSAAYKAKQDDLMRMVAAGVPQVRAAEMVGISESTACRWLKECPEEVEQLRADMSKDARNVLRAGARGAAEMLVKLALSGDRQAIIALLDRVGIGTKQELEITGDAFHVKPETLEKQLVEALALLRQGNDEAE